MRDIATAARVSPALVIKLFGSKAELFAEVGAVSVPLSELRLPRESLGRALVQRLLTRRENGSPEPWATVVHTIREAPDPRTAADTTTDEWLSAIATLIGDTTVERVHAAIVISLLIGLAEGVRVLGLLPEREISRDELADLYGPIVQRQIDACAD